MACHTIDLGAEAPALEHGIEFEEENRRFWVQTIDEKRGRKVSFCTEHPPRRINGLTLLCAELFGEKIRAARSGDVALLHIKNSHEIRPHGPEGIIILGKKIALVQLAKDTGVRILSKNGKHDVVFKNGQVHFKLAA